MSHWEEKYRAKTIPWDRGVASPALIDWVENGVLLPGRVLIPGCGRGHEALELARHGFQVSALDIAPTALEHLATELHAAGVDAERVCADALTWQPAQPFDAIYEQTCLCALDPTHWAAYAQQLHSWLRPGGKLFALFMQTDMTLGNEQEHESHVCFPAPPTPLPLTGEGSVESRSATSKERYRPGGPPFHCALPEMRTLFDAARWQWPETEPRQVVHPDNLFELAVVLTRRG
jgi:SAM-dependent methyltransferase